MISDWFGRARFGVFVATAMALLSAFGGAPGSAGNDGRVFLSPESTTVPIGATFSVEIVAEPPAGTLAAWVVEFTYDPLVIEVHGCEPVEAPPGSVGAGDCRTEDRDPGDGLEDTARTFGAVLFTRSDGGFTEPVSLATFDFIAVGPSGSQSDLALAVEIFADADGGAHTPDLAGGVVDISIATQGDVNCDGEVDIADFGALMAHAAAVDGAPTACVGIGDPEETSGFAWGDVSCDGAVDAVDALSVLTHEIGIQLEQATEPCFDVGRAMA